MKFAQRLLLAAPLAVLATVAHAHPGHDGHELTWDFHSHGLWDSPVALVIGAALVATLLYRLTHKRG